MLGLAGLCVAAAVFFSLKPVSTTRVPRTSGALHEQAPHDTHDVRDVRDIHAGPQTDMPPTWLAIMRMPMVWRVSAVWFGSCILSLGLQSWMPSWLMHEHGIDILHIGVLSAIPFLVSFVGTNVIGQIIDGCEPTRLRHLLAAGASLSAVFLALMTRTISIGLLMLWWTLCMVSFDMVYATVFSIPLKTFAPSIAGRTTGLINFSGQLAGAIASVVMGRLIAISHGSYAGAFVFLIGAGVAACAVALTCQFGKQTHAVTAAA